MMKPTRIENERGIAYSADTGSTPAFIPNTQNIGEELASAMETLTAGLNIFHARIVENSKTYKDDAEPGANARELAAFKTTFKRAFSTITTEARGFAEADAKSLGPGPLGNAIWEAAFVAEIKALPMPERIQATANLPHARSSALLRHGDLDRMGLPPEVAEAVRDRHRLTGHLDKTGLAANFARTPSLTDPTATGVDMEAAEAAAMAAGRRHKQRKDHLDLAAQTLRGIAAYVAAATGKRPETVWAELVA